MVDGIEVLLPSLKLARGLRPAAVREMQHHHWSLTLTPTTTGLQAKPPHFMNGATASQPSRPRPKPGPTEQSEAASSGADSDDSGRSEVCTHIDTDRAHAPANV